MEQVLARFVANMLRVKPRTRSHDDDEPSMRCFGLGWILLAVGDLEPGKADDAGEGPMPSSLGAGPSSSCSRSAVGHRGKPTLKVEVLRNHFNTKIHSKPERHWRNARFSRTLFGQVNTYLLLASLTAIPDHLYIPYPLCTRPEARCLRDLHPPKRPPTTPTVSCSRCGSPCQITSWSR
jgi:hypothetical protein